MNQHGGGSSFLIVWARTRDVLDPVRDVNEGTGRGETLNQGRVEIDYPRIRYPTHVMTGWGGFVIPGNLKDDLGSVLGLMTRRVVEIKQLYPGSQSSRETVGTCAM